MALEKKKKKNDLILLGSLLVIALMYFIGSRALTGNEASEAIIEVNGITVGTYDLSDSVDEMMIATGTNGGSVHITIKDGGITVTKSSCPDKICVKQGTVRQSGQTIVCLPNKLIVTVQ